MPSNTLPKGWRVLPFAEIAENITERVDDPASSGLEYYVGLEHLDTNTPTISRWGSPSDVEATKLRFYPRDVVYARRRAYQRKLGVAEWEGLCSAHALVLRARPEVCLPQFLPYFLQSDQFHQRALDISVGSLSPTINWRALAVQEFALPSVDGQKEIIEILGACRTLMDAVAAVMVAVRRSLDSIAAASLHDPHSVVGAAKPYVGTRVPLGTLADLRRGRFSHRPRNEPRLYSDSGPNPFVQTGDIQRASRHLTDYSQFLSEEGVGYSRCVPEGTLLITIAAVIGATAYTTSTTYLPDSVVSLCPRGDNRVEYLELLLRGLRSQLENEVATENTQKNLSVKLLEAVEVPSVPRDVQDWLVEQAEGLWRVEAASSGSLHALSALQRRLREDLLLQGGGHVQ